VGIHVVDSLKWTLSIKLRSRFLKSLLVLGTYVCPLGMTSAIKLQFSAYFFSSTRSSRSGLKTRHLGLHKYISTGSWVARSFDMQGFRFEPEILYFSRPKAFDKFHEIQFYNLRPCWSFWTMKQVKKKNWIKLLIFCCFFQFVSSLLANSITMLINVWFVQMVKNLSFLIKQSKMFDILFLHMGKICLLPTNNPTYPTW
jgi:hypothetical protein